MINDEIEIAKEIFLRFNGSHFQMVREGEYETYKNFSISKEQEIIWINEYADLLISEIQNKAVVDDNFMNLVSIIKQYKQNDKFEKLFKWVKLNVHKFDSFTNLRIAEEILDIVEEYKESNQNSELVNKAKKFSLNILHEIYQKPIIVAKYYEDIDYLYGCLEEDVVRKRIESNLKEWGEGNF